MSPRNFQPDDLSAFYFASNSTSSSPSQQIHDHIINNCNHHHDPTHTASDKCHFYCYTDPICVDWMEAKWEQSTSGHGTSTRTRGRCLRTTRDVAAGELLFVTSPIVFAPVQEIHHEWKQSQQQHGIRPTNGTHDQSVASVAEEVLLRQCHQALQADPSTSVHGRAVVNSLSVLEDGSYHNELSSTLPSIECLTGQDDTVVNLSKAHSSSLFVFTNDRILQIIRRNAFGGDFATAQSVEQRWKSGDDSYLPHRLLGLYPLAAMINHSCTPNAVRVFAPNEIMIVHACQPIAAGNEIVWSYIPLTQTVQQRRQCLVETHGFVCNCERCYTEDNVALNQDYESVSDLEERLHSKSFSIIITSPVQRYLRVSYLPIYMDYLNQSASDPTKHPELLQL